MKNNKKTASLFAVPLIFIIVCVVALFIVMLFISRYNYYSGAILEGAEYLGLENYKSFVTDSSFWFLIRNSAIIGIGSAIFGGVYIFASLWGLGGIKNKWLRAAVLCVPVILASIPTVMYAGIWYQLQFNNPELNWHMHKAPRALTIIFETFSWASVWIIAGSFFGEKREDKRHCLGTALIFAGLRLVFLFYSDPVFSIIGVSDITREFGETISSFIYHRGRVYGDYGYASAISIIRLLPSVLISAAFACVYMRVSAKFTKQVKTECAAGQKRTLWILPIILGGICIVILCIMRIYNTQVESGFFQETPKQSWNAVKIIKVLAVPIIIAILVSAVTWLITYAVSVRNMLVTLCYILVLPFVANTFWVFLGGFRAIKSNTAILTLIYLLQSPAWVFVFLAATGFKNETPAAFFKRMTPMIIMGCGLMYAHQICDFTVPLYSRTVTTQTVIYNTMTMNRLYIRFGKTYLL